MSDQSDPSTNPDPASPPPSADPPADPPADPANPPANPEGDPQGDPEEGNPDGDSFPRTYVETLRRENAASRTKLRELEAAMADAKTPEQVAQIVADLKDENEKLVRDALVGRIASKYNLPAELAARLTGDDEAALEADAKALAKFAPPAETDPELNGGLDPHTGDAGPAGPRAVLAAARGGSRRRRR